MYWNSIITNLNLADIYKTYKIYVENKTIFKTYICEAKFVYSPLSPAEKILVKPWKYLSTNILMTACTYKKLHIK